MDIDFSVHSGPNTELGMGEAQWGSKPDTASAPSLSPRSKQKSDRKSPLETSLVVQWLNPHSQSRGPTFNLWLGNQVARATTKDPTCCN